MMGICITTQETCQSHVQSGAQRGFSVQVRTEGRSETSADRRREPLGGSGGHTPTDLFVFFIFRASEISFLMISRAETFINRSKHEKTLTITLLFICQPTWVLLMYVYIDSVFINCRCGYRKRARRLLHDGKIRKLNQYPHACACAYGVLPKRTASPHSQAAFDEGFSVSSRR